VKLTSILLTAWATLAAGSALAQGSNAVNLLGTVDKFDATSLSVTDVSGAARSFALAPNLLILRNTPASLSDIRPNDFVASAAVRGEDGRLHSTELRIFPEAFRGAGEGQRPMNDTRNQTMTNATVTGAAVVNGSNNINVSFAGRESELVLDPGVPITRIDAADRALVKPGVKVRVQITNDAAGPLAARIVLQ